MPKGLWSDSQLNETSDKFAFQNELCGLHKVAPVYVTDSPGYIFLFLEDLPDVQIIELQALVLKRKDIFFMNDTDLGQTNLVQHNIS